MANIVALLIFDFITGSLANGNFAFYGLFGIVTLSSCIMDLVIMGLSRSMFLINCLLFLF